MVIPREGERGFSFVIEGREEMGVGEKCVVVIVVVVVVGRETSLLGVDCPSGRDGDKEEEDDDEIDEVGVLVVVLSFLLVCVLLLFFDVVVLEDSLEEPKNC